MRSRPTSLVLGDSYRKDTEPIYHSIMYSLVSTFFPVSIHYRNSELTIIQMIFGTRIKVMWEEQLFDPPIDYITSVNVL